MLWLTKSPLKNFNNWIIPTIRNHSLPPPPLLANFHNPATKRISDAQKLKIWLSTELIVYNLCTVVNLHYQLR